MSSRRYSSADLATLRSNPGAVLPAPKKRSQEESIMQRNLIRWWKENCATFVVPEICLFSIPNGGGRSGPVTGSILKAEGLRKGAPDLFLAVPRKKVEAFNLGPQRLDLHSVWCGLFLELKRKNGIVSPEQTAFHEALRAQGYSVWIARELGTAIDIITTYLTK